MLRDDYRGNFDPRFHIADLSRAALSVLGREWLLHGHLQDRVGMPLVHDGRPREEMQQIAIDEWMSASPVYSRRTQRALHFPPGDVACIMKNIQLDIGAPHHFMDFRCRVDDSHHGEFWLAHCGALMDVEPMGEDYVHGMCHTIEDPTFDATAVASNPRAQVRPVHRPPRTPADRHPHCHWTVTIDESADPVEAHPNYDLVMQSRVADIAVDDPGTNAEPGGWADYSGPFDPDFELEDLSHRALVVALQEVAVQSHLLFRGYLIAVAQHRDASTALALAPRVATGLAGITAQRLLPALQIVECDATGIAKLLQIHPMFWPRTYVDLRVELVDDARVRFALGPCPVLEEADGYTWFAQLDGASVRALDAIVQAVDRRASCRAVPTEGDERFAYEVVIDPAAPEAKEPDEMLLGKISTGAAWVFTPRRRVRV
jgi:hypothetical protein